MPKIPHVYYDKASRGYFPVVSLGFDDKTKNKRRREALKRNQKLKSDMMIL